MEKRGEIFRKRGLSAVVTTLLIILLALVAIGILWVVLSNVISEGAESITLGSLFLDMDIQNIGVDNSSGDISVTVRRNIGKGDMSKIIFVVSDGLNSRSIERDSVGFGELETRIFILTGAELQGLNVTEISIAPVILLDSGKEKPGSVVDKVVLSGGGFQNACTCSGNVCQPPGDTGLVCNTCDYVLAPPESCADSIDNNCDGSVNEGCSGGDTIPPTATIIAPTASQVLVSGTTSTGLTVTTNEAATCKFSLTDQSYSLMPDTMSGGGSGSHSATLSPLMNKEKFTGI